MSQQQSMLGVEKDENGNTLVKVFISYRRNDNLFNHLLDIVNRTMDKLNNDLLKDTEYRVEKVIDLNSISIGDNWPEKIDKDLSKSDILLAFITEEYLTSDPCRYEFNTFRTNQIDTRNDSEKHHGSLCVPVFWAAQKTVADKLKDKSKLHFDNEKDSEAAYTNACETWTKIKEVNGVEGILPKLIDLLKNEAQGPDYFFIKDCIVQWLANKVKAAIDHMQEDATEEIEDIPVKINVPQDISKIELHTFGRGSKAYGFFTSDGFVVKGGSKIAEGTTASARKPTYESRQKYQHLINEDNILSDDLVFPTPSAASAFVIGRCSSGMADWKTEGGKQLGELLEEEKRRQLLFRNRNKGGSVQTEPRFFLFVFALQQKYSAAPKDLTAPPASSPSGCKGHAG